MFADHDVKPGPITCRPGTWPFVSRHEGRFVSRLPAGEVSVVRQVIDQLANPGESPRLAVIPGEQPRGGSRRARAGVHKTVAWPVLPARPRVWQLGAVCLPGCPGGSCYMGRVPAVPGAAAARSALLGCRPLAQAGEVPGPGVCAGCPERISGAGEVRRACIRPRLPRRSMTVPAMNAATSAIPAIMPMVPKA